MRPRSLDAEIAKLYQLPLDEFTGARNALARDAGSDGAAIRALQKPPLPAWAVNQLYWTNREVYDALVEAATELRAAHQAVLGGRRADLRGASKTHDEALDRALKATLDQLAANGHKATDATRQAVLNTLRALPTDDPPGRLPRTLQPGGFEMLAGFSVAPAKARPDATRVPARRARQDRAARKEPAREGRAALQKRRAAAREAAADAARELRDAETELRRQEFAAARAAREAEKAAARLQQAREALAAAERAVDDAEHETASAEKARERAQRAAEHAQAAVDAARTRRERAQEALDELEASE